MVFRWVTRIMILISVSISLNSFLKNNANCIKASNYFSFN